MLRLVRRHLQACKYRSTRYRRCQCPIHVYGTLAGEKIRRALDLTSWEAATDVVNGWTVSGQIGVVRPEIPNVQDAVARFLQDAEARHLKESSVRKYRQLLEGSLVPFCERTGRTSLRQLMVPALRELRESWKFSATTQVKKLELLKGFIRFCETAGWIHAMPPAALKPPKVAPPPTLPFSEQDVTRLLDACDRFAGDRDRMRALILLLRHSGLRISDAASLRRDRIHNKALVLRTEKTGTAVYCPLRDTVIDALDRLPGTEYFFWSGNGKVKSVVEDLRRSFVRIARLADVRRAHFHRFRHLFAVSLLEKGVSVETIAVLLGNSPQIVLKHYSPWIRSRQLALEEAVKKAWT